MPSDTDSAPAVAPTLALSGLLPADDRFASSVIRDLLANARAPGVVSLAGGLPAAELLPTERIAEAVSAVLAERGPGVVQYGLTAGEPELRELLATQAGGEIDRIVVTTGSQQALDLVLAVMSDHQGEPPVAVMEDPGYIGAIQAMRSRRYQLNAIPVDDQGLRVDVLERRLADGLRPRVCYVNPSFQNPTGSSLAADRADRLVELAEEYRFLVISDDPYVELHLDGDRPHPLPASPYVARLGSMSKTLAPGLRVGWLDADAALAERVARAKQPADLHASTLSQSVVASILADQTYWTAHLQRLRAAYRQRRTALLEPLATTLPAATVAPQAGGFFLWTELRRGNTALANSNTAPQLLERALLEGVAFVPGSAFSVEGGGHRGHVRLSYSNGDPSQFGLAVARMAAAIGGDGMAA